MTAPAAPTVRTATSAAECAAIRPLVESHIDFECGSAAVAPDWADTMAGFVEEGRLRVFVASDASGPVGYATATTDVATWTGEIFAHLDCLFVLDTRRGSGIGSLLVQAVVEDARNRGLRRLEWQTPEWNAPAIGFYERLGATHLPKLRFALALE